MECHILNPLTHCFVVGNLVTVTLTTTGTYKARVIFHLQAQAYTVNYMSCLTSSKEQFAIKKEIKILKKLTHIIRERLTK